MNRLALLVDCHLVFYMELFKGSTFIWRHYKSNFRAGHCRYFLFCKKKVGRGPTQLTLQESSICLDNQCRPFFALGSSTVGDRSALLRSLAESCQLDPSLCQHLFLPNLNQLSALSSQLYSIYQKKIVVVEFKGARGRSPTVQTAKRYFEAPAKCIFQVVAIIASPVQVRSVTALDPKTIDYVLCSYGDNIFCRLSAEYAERVKALLLVQTNEDVTRDKVVTLEVGAGGPNLFGQSRLAEKQIKDKKIQEKRSKRWGDRVKKFCRCPNCAPGEKEYDVNMSRGGPEKLLTHKLIPSELVKILGAKSDETDAILEQLSRLSVAAFDIEATTVPLDHETYFQSHIPLAEIDSATRAQLALAVQKPIMLAHRDALMHSGEPCQVFTLESDQESGVYSLVKKYWKFVLQRRARARTVKKQLALPLLLLCEKYKKAYFDYAQHWRPPITAAGGEKKLELPQIVSGWRQSLPGRLEGQLNRLIDSYEIFSFYGSGYDHVLLQAYLVPYLFEKKLSPKLEKNGNKITAIKVNKLRINFRDVVKLLSPGTSLRQFGQLFKLTQEKAHFPFFLLTGLEALNLPHLPKTVSEWNSPLSLNKTAMSQAEVDDSIKLFEQNNCQSLGDYLKIYLRLDVDILYCATQGLRQMVAKEIGVDFVQTGNFTISSVSNLAGDRCAAANLQFGQFFPNNSSVYRLLRKGMRG